jgi:hypothetical protein
MNVSEAEKRLVELVNKVHAEGISVDLESDNQVLARLTPARPQSPLAVVDLSRFLHGLPRLDDDADAFSEEVRAIRGASPTEGNPWD